MLKKSLNKCFINFIKLKYYDKIWENMFSSKANKKKSNGDQVAFLSAPHTWTKR